MKIRIDKLLVERGLVQSRERAQALVLAGKVLVNEQKVEKPGAAVAEDAAVRLLGEDLKYVSRGGLKLQAALEHWAIDVRGRVCMDVGASTGGFTDCLLQHGAAQVIAVDTGYGQMDYRLRRDDRVRLLEKTNARYLKPEDVGEQVEIAVMDVSFISATLLLPAIMKAAHPRELVVLVKPQFEAGREYVEKGGIVRDPIAQQAAVEKVCRCLRELGFATDVIESPILGMEGNREFLVHATIAQSLGTGPLACEAHRRACTMALTKGSGGSRMRAAAIISKPAKPELYRVAPELLQWLKQHNYKIYVDEETAVYAPDEEVVKRLEIADLRPDFAIVLGGDGTLLSAARAVSRQNVPIIAVNLGSLGFLTEVPLDEVYETLDAVDKGQCPMEKRSMLHCQLMRNGECVAEFHALNDAVVNKSAIARLVSIDLYVDGVFVSNYKADGVIVSTPTGSTAYSLAAGGPILMPSLDGFVVTPVCPHSLTHRPLVARDTAEIEIVCRGMEQDAFLSIDGQVGMPVIDGDRVLCQKSQYQVKLLRLKKTFFEVLRTKLKWGQR